ncbi:ABC transporter permease [Clostridium sp. Marseille-P299]|uniref:ABC transporter permease n=1 Tax=Clostridium sp. Marseille-P299 TaxID=1805477 RepID=UPI000830D6F1|nr:ABC transporter permease subunit [Clostridium sp. Marseille-P299]
MSGEQRNKTSQIAPAAHKKKGIPLKYRLFLLAVPFLILIFIFSYLPLYGWRYAFYDYKPPLKLSQCEFVGFKWFTLLFQNKGWVTQIIKVLKNTLAMSGLGILVSILPVAFAIFLSEIKSKRTRNVFQTMTTIPNFISWVIVYSVAFSLFSTTGMANSVLQNIGIISKPIAFLDSPNHVWLKMCLWGVWKGLGWSSIMYLAAITSCDQELYEAAKADGAGRFRLMWHITLPQLLPTYFVLLMLNVANILTNGMEQYFVFANAFNKDKIQVLDYYVYAISMGGGNTYSLGVAIGILKSLISITLLYLVNKLSKAVRGETIV